MLNRRDLLAAGLAAGTAVPALAARRPASLPRRIPLWNEGLPEPAPLGLVQKLAERSSDPSIKDRALTGVSAPWLEHFRPIGGNGAAIVAIPGGGYRHMAWDKEALDIAARFALHGVTGFALAYRLPGDGWSGGFDTPLADAQRAIRLIRSQATALRIDPQRVAVVGFSAGGHLAANLAAQWDRSVYAPRDFADSLSARPNLAAPIYAAVMLEALGGALPVGKAEDLLRHSPHLHVRAESPPHFLLHAEDDPLVSSAHSLALRAALLAKGVAVETHLHAKGGHGFGLRPTRDTTLDDWPQRLLAFGRTTGWIR